MKKPEAVIFDPEHYLVGKIDIKKLKLPDGVYQLAHHQQSGLRLWGRVVNGAALCARFTNVSGELLETITIFKPFPGGGPRPEPKPPQPFPCPGGPIAGDDGPDGGTGGGGSQCFICTAGGGADGGSICFLVPC